MRGLLSFENFGSFIAAYVALDVLLVVFDTILVAKFPAWGALISADYKSGEAIINGIASFLITAQVGVLGVVSIALALVTLVAQRDAASTDVRIYYHEALAFEIVASCIALLAVLCAQLVWPLQALLHAALGGQTPLALKWVLLCAHIVWLILNLAALAHFVATTFRFVQQSSRERIRRMYTANVIVPDEITKRRRIEIYARIGGTISQRDASRHGALACSLRVGFPASAAGTTEVATVFKRRVDVHDVRTVLLDLAFWSWSRRCRKAATKAGGAATGAPTPLLVVSPMIGRSLFGRVVWCHRHGGVKLSCLERGLLKAAFRFKRSDHAR